MAVRLHATWMSQGDERLLEFLATEGTHPVGELAQDERIQLSRAHANVRLSKLSQTALITAIGNGVYRITDTGEAYLAGEFDARTLEPPDEH